MKKTTEQLNFWEGQFGKDYTDRNLFSIEELDEFYKKTWGTSRTEMNNEFLCKFDKNIKILEVGCNNGQQLRHLQKEGFTNLYGIEIQKDAVQKAKQSTKDINIIRGSAFDIPFKTGWFDLVFTSGVLIHIAPMDLDIAISEIYRCSNSYIWGFEYYSKQLEEINYRGNKGFLWKQNFMELYINKYPDLKILKEKKFKYANEDNEDQMFLLQK